MSNWTADEIPDLEGKTAVVTGANSGLGLEATKNLAEKNAEVVMACRKKEKGLDAKKEIKDEIEDADLEVMQVDLASLDSVHHFAEKVNSKYEKLDLLFNNAGVMAIPRKETEDSFEYQFGVNHLGHFALTGQLIEKLEAADGEARVVTQSSVAHENGKIDFEDINQEKEYDRMQAYSNSKLANLLFARELDRKLKSEDIEVKSVACHPGVSTTNLFNAEESQHGFIATKVMGLALKVFGQSPEKGCLPMLYAAVSEDIEGGEYIGPDGLKSFRGNPEKQTASKKARDKDLAEKLWRKSEEMTGVDYNL